MDGSAPTASRFLAVVVALAAGLSGCSGGANKPADAGGGSGGADGGGDSCASGALAFRLDVDDSAGWSVIDSGQGCAPPNWLSIRDGRGDELAVGNPDLHCCTFANCMTCSFEDVVCTTGWRTLPLPATRTWNGAFFPKGSCGANATACVMEKACAPPGDYQARMCAQHYVGDVEQTACIDVPFSIPATGTVIGRL